MLTILYIVSESENIKSLFWETTIIELTLCPNLMNLSRVSNSSKPVFMERRLNSWKIQFYVEPTIVEPRLKFFKFGLWISN